MSDAFVNAMLNMFVLTVVFSVLLSGIGDFKMCISVGYAMATV